MIRNVFANPSVSGFEVILAIIFALAFALVFGFFDGVVFNLYVLPTMSECYPENMSVFCQDVRELLGITDPNDQLAIGDAYWNNILVIIVLGTGTTLAIFRFVAGYLAGSRSIMLFFVSFLWFLSGVILYYFGWIDLTYYITQGTLPPDFLPWLNDLGFFKITQNFGTGDVQRGDLYLLNVIGLGILIGLWLWMHQHHKRNHFDRLLD